VQATPTPVLAAGPSSPEGNGESIFFQGFVAAVLLIVLLTAFIVIVLVTLLVAWRIMRMRRYEGQTGG
jgi:hypothetical protein